jgi:mRNA interferase HigB
MNVVTKKRLEEFWSLHPKAKAPLSSWYKVVKAAEWKSPQDIRNQFNTADFVGDNRVIFDIGGNNYRVVARVSYTYKQVLVKFVGTHEEYDAIHPETI